MQNDLRLIIFHCPTCDSAVTADLTRLMGTFCTGPDNMVYMLSICGRCETQWRTALGSVVYSTLETFDA